MLPLDPQTHGRIKCRAKHSHASVKELDLRPLPAGTCLLDEAASEPVVATLAPSQIKTYWCGGTAA